MHVIHDSPELAISPPDGVLDIKNVALEPLGGYQDEILQKLAIFSPVLQTFV